MQSSLGKDDGNAVEYVEIDSDDEYELNELPFRAKNKEYPNKYSSKDDIEELDFVDSSKWYSITVDDPGKHNKNDIFDAILRSISPLEFVPVLSEKGTILKKFYVTRCEGAIKKISLAGFQFFVQGDTFPFFLKVVHNDPPHKIINPFKLVHEVIMKRFNKGSSELNLMNFKDDNDILDVVYFPLWYPGNQKVVKLLIKALSLTPHIRILNLSNNSLRDINAFCIPSCFNNIHTLILSNNLISELDSLKCLQGYTSNINVLWLDGNDLCLNFIQEQHYIECVKVFFPAVTTLDGKVFKFDGFPVIQRNFTVDQTSVLLVNRFMEMYFTLFDSEERDLLTEMYTNKALFQITCHASHISNFHKRSRNILITKQKGGSVFVGPRGIIGCLGFLPKTEHDPLTFTVDVLYHKENHTQITITGVFKIPSSVLSQDEPVFEFMRTFILVKVNENYCYKIANDFLNISSSLSTRAANAFTHTVTVKNKFSLTSMYPSNLDQPVKDGMIEVFIHLSRLPYSDAEMCLTRNKWNFRSALLDAINILQKEM